MSGAVPERKPNGRAGAPETCFCQHARSQHIGGKCASCDCESYRRRPCVCGHRHEEHGEVCNAAECKCRFFRQDNTPEFLLRRGIRAGEWQFATQPQFRWLMRPQQDMNIRVWACGMLHTIGYGGRLAVRLTPDGQPLLDKLGKPLGLSPADIVAELNALDTIPRLSKQNVRRALAELEQQGAARRVGRQHHGVRLFFYFRPLKSREVVISDYLAPVTDTKGEYLADKQILEVKKSVVKAFRRALRIDCSEVVKCDSLSQVGEILDAVGQVVTFGYLTAREVVKSGKSIPGNILGLKAFLTASGASTYTSTVSSPPSSSTPAAQQPAAVTMMMASDPTSKTNPEDAVLEVLSEYGAINAEAIAQLVSSCRAAQPTITPAEIVALIRQEAPKARKNPIGFLLAAVPKACVGRPFAKFRAEQAAAAARAVERFRQYQAEEERMRADKAARQARREHLLAHPAECEHCQGRGEYQRPLPPGIRNIHGSTITATCDCPAGEARRK